MTANGNKADKGDGSSQGAQGEPAGRTHPPGGGQEEAGLTSEQKERIEAKRLEALIRQQGNVLDAESISLEMHDIDEQWCTGKEEEEHFRKVKCFLSHIRWQKKEDELGGFTWIELWK